MKICIDCTPIGLRTTDKGGVYRYLFRLVESLGAIDADNGYVLFFNFFRGEHLAAYRELPRILRVGRNFRFRLSRFPTRLQRLFEPPVDFLSGPFDVFHGGFDYLPRFLGGKGIVTIHDIRYLDAPEEDHRPEWVDILRRDAPRSDFFVNDYLSRGKLFDHLKGTIGKTVSRADGIITVSRFCKGKIAGALRVPEEKIRVVPLGVDPLFRPRPREEVAPTLARFGISKPYLLYAGKNDPLKNLIRVLESFRTVARFHDVILVMAGPVNWYYYILRDAAKRLGILDRMVMTSFVGDDELAALYSGASLFLMPSLYEGFGLPVAEAMASGVPVVASDVCSIPEVAGDAALLVDPLSADAIADASCRILSDAGTARELSARGLERAARFRWDETARQTLAFYGEVRRA